MYFTKKKKENGVGSRFSPR